MFKKLPILLCLLPALLAANVHPLNELHRYGDALNIEGGTIPREYLTDKQLWSNICVVLDRPFEDGSEWQEITDANIYPLKESSLPEYNEASVNLAYVSILHYYIVNAQELLGKSPDSEATVLIQVHRNSSGPKQLELLNNLLTRCFPELRSEKQEGAFKNELFRCFFPDLKVHVRFCFGVKSDSFIQQGIYNDADIVLSYSLVAGFNRDWQSGSLLIPKQWTPFPLSEMRIHQNQSYCCRNHLLEVLDTILKTQSNALINCVNENFHSPNPNKKQIADYLTRSDFKIANLLQVDGMFNPSQLPLCFEVE